MKQTFIRIMYNNKYCQCHLIIWFDIKVQLGLFDYCYVRKRSYEQLNHGHKAIINGIFCIVIWQFCSQFTRFSFRWLLLSFIISEISNRHGIQSTILSALWIDLNAAHKYHKHIVMAQMTIMSLDYWMNHTKFRRNYVHLWKSKRPIYMHTHNGHKCTMYIYERIAWNKIIISFKEMFWIGVVQDFHRFSCI